MEREVLVYISIPIGYGKLPTPRQYEAAKEKASSIQQKLETAGFTVLNPLSLVDPRGKTYDVLMAECIGTLRKKRPIMFFANGWVESSGCIQEWEESNRIGLYLYQEQYDGLNHLVFDYQDHLNGSYPNAATYFFLTGLNL